MNYESQTEEYKQQDNPYLIPAAVIISAVLISGAWILSARRENNPQKTVAASAADRTVVSSQGVTLPVSWGDLGKQLVDAGVIDAEKFKALYGERGGFTDEYEKLLSGKSDEKLVITPDNAGFLLNLLWALGLANSNPILDYGEMADPRYGGPQNFASTGGWTMAVGDPMDHYSRHVFLTLTKEQQELVARMAKGIYRPCCGNSTHFPDCNHGMAMLGLLQLMASQGATEQNMWEAALSVNALWFPDTYRTIAAYLQMRGIAWNDTDPREVLGYEYSSGVGYAKIKSSVNNVPSGGGGGCSA